MRSSKAVRALGVVLWILAMGPITQAALFLLYVTAGTIYARRLPWAALSPIGSLAYLAALVAWLQRRWARSSALFMLSLVAPWWLWPPSAVVPGSAAVVASLLAARDGRRTSLVPTERHI